MIVIMFRNIIFLYPLSYSPPHGNNKTNCIEIIILHLSFFRRVKVGGEDLTLDGPTHINNSNNNRIKRFTDELRNLRELMRFIVSLPSTLSWLPTDYIKVYKKRSRPEVNPSKKSHMPTLLLVKQILNLLYSESLKITSPKLAFIHFSIQGFSTTVLSMLSPK